MVRRKSGQQQDSAETKPKGGATSGHEAELWAMADALLGSMDAAEDRDEYLAENIVWVPPEARWTHLKRQARQSTIGLIVDGAMAVIERDNPALRDVLTPGRYVGAEPKPDDCEPFEAKMKRLVAALQAQQAEGVWLDAAIAENLRTLGLWGE